MVYAEGTSVPVEKSRAEIERVLEKYGAKSFAYAKNEAGAMLQFQAHDRFIRFELPLPSREAEEFRFTKHKVRHNRVRLSDERAYQLWEQACRERWRSLVIAIKAKLEAVRCGISEFENEFMANIVLPNGQTLSEVIRPKIAEAYATNDMPKLLALPGPR